MDALTLATSKLIAYTPETGQIGYPDFPVDEVKNSA